MCWAKYHPAVNLFKYKTVTSEKENQFSKLFLTYFNVLSNSHSIQGPAEVTPA